MARTTYSPEVRTSILTATRQARDAGKSWNEALQVAEAAGYSGNVKSLYQLVLRSDRLSGEPDNGHDAPISFLSEPTKIPSIAEPRPVQSQLAFEYMSLTLTTQQSPDSALNRVGAKAWELATAMPVSTVLLQDGAQVTRIQYVFRRPCQLGRVRGD